MAKQDLQRIRQLLEELGEIQNQKTRIEIDLNEQVRPIIAEAEKQKKPLEAKLNRRFDELKRIAQAQRAKLTDQDKKKTVKLPVGEFGWRKTNLSIEVLDEDEAVNWLKDNRLSKLIRTKEVVDKQSAKKELKKAPQMFKYALAISVISPKEIFWVKPAKINLKFEKDQNGRLKAKKVKKRK